MHDLKNLLVPYLAALWRGRWAAMLIAWLICLAGWVVVALLPNTYTSTARMFVDTDTLLSPLMKDLAVTPDFDRQVEIMRDTLFSVPQIEELIERTGIDQNVESELDRVELIEELTDKLYLSILGRNLFEIGYHSGDPDTSFIVVKSMIDIFVEQQLGHSTRDGVIAGEFIDEQIAAYDEKLRAAELRVAEFQRENAEELGGAERSVRDLDSTESEVRRLRAELDSAHWRRDQLKIKLDSTPKTVAGSQAGNDGRSPAEQQLVDLNKELIKKRLVYTNQHPDILALQQLIDQATQQVQEERAGGLEVTSVGVPNPLYDQLTSQLQVIEVSIDDLTRRIEVAKAEREAVGVALRQAPKVQADLKRLNRDYDVLLSQYDQLTQRRESALLARELDEGKKRIEFRTVEPPVRPLQPSGPPHGLFMLGVLVLGIGVGGALIIARYMLSNTLLTTAQLENTFPGLSVLGGVSEAQPGGIGPFASRVGIVGSGAALIGVFVVLFYFFAISPEKPDIVQIASDITGNITGDFISKRAKAEP